MVPVSVFLRLFYYALGVEARCLIIGPCFGELQLIISDQS